MRYRLLIFMSVLGIVSCKQETKSKDKVSAKFQHGVNSGPKPWTSETFEATEEDFTFGIISDLNGGEREGVYATAVEQLNMLDPTFVLSVGDLIDGGTEDTLQLKREWDSFDERTAKLRMPFFHLGGNHDLTNPVMQEFWKNRFGPRYYYFIYNNVLFLMMDSEDYEEKRMMEIYNARAKALKIIKGEIDGNYEESEYYNMPERSVGGMSNAQLEYFTKVLEDHQDVKWTFVLMHKPLWMRDDEKGLGPLEHVLANRDYSVINGHFHSFSNQIRNGHSYTILGTTGGSQDPLDSLSFDHISLVRMSKKPIITHLKMEGVLNEQGKVPDSM